MLANANHELYTESNRRAYAPMDGCIPVEEAQKLALKQTGGGEIVAWELRWDNELIADIYSAQIVHGNKKTYVDIDLLESKVTSSKSVDIIRDDKAHTYSLAQPPQGGISAAAAAKAALSLTADSKGRVMWCEPGYHNGTEAYQVRILGQFLNESKVRYEFVIALSDGKALAQREIPVYSYSIYDKPLSSLDFTHYY